MRYFHENGNLNIYKDIKNFDEFSFLDLLNLINKSKHKLLLDDGYYNDENQTIDMVDFDNGKKIWFNKIGLSKKSDEHKK